MVELPSPTKLNRPRGREIASESLSNLGNIGNVDLGEGLLIATAALAFVLILIPVLFFGAELIILGALLAAGMTARTLLVSPGWSRQRRSILSPPDVDSNGASAAGGSPAS